MAENSPVCRHLFICVCRKTFFINISNQSCTQTSTRNKEDTAEVNSVFSAKAAESIKLSPSLSRCVAEDSGKMGKTSSRTTDVLTGDKCVFMLQV